MAHPGIGVSGLAFGSCLRMVPVIRSATMFRHPAPLLLLALVACSDRPPHSACGVAALAGPTMLLSEFGTPGQTLGFPPDSLPPRLPVRIVAGPALSAIVGRTDSTWVIGVEGAAPASVTPGFGVLVLGTSGAARGVMIFEGSPVNGAPVIGQVTIGAATVPLIGIRLDPARYEDPHCPVFPDSTPR